MTPANIPFSILLLKIQEPSLPFYMVTLVFSAFLKACGVGARRTPGSNSFLRCGATVEKALSCALAHPNALKGRQVRRASLADLKVQTV